MKKIILMQLLFIGAFFGIAQEIKSVSEVKWYTMAEAIELQKTTPAKRLFIDVYADWCGPCKLLEKETFHDPAVIDSLNANFIPVRMNAEKQETFVFNNRKFELMTSETGQTLNAFVYYMLQGRVAYPSCLFVNADGSLYFYTRGFMPANELLPILSENK